jgi:phycobilisome core-membrane linker protein
MNSQEYSEVFGEDTVPYRRFPTLPAANFPNTQRLYNQLTKQNDDLVVPSFKTVKSRIDSDKTPILAKAIADLAAEAKRSFVELGRSSNDGGGQSVEVARQPIRIHRLTDATTQAQVVINAIYSQVMDVYSSEVPDYLRLADLESELSNGEISVREFVQELASSDIYCQRFCTPYPSAKVVELLFRHLLGRAPASQDEISQYNNLLADGGLRAAVAAIVNSAEYSGYFGEDVVPYSRVSA